MSRLRHTAPGFFRSLQISAANFVAITEGQLDRAFYSHLVAHHQTTRAHIVSTIRTSSELRGGAGGKSTMLSYFQYLRKQSKLVSELGGKKTLIVFFADKDIDDVTRSRKRSPHLIYTDLFDVESYLYLYGNVATAASAATSLDLQTVLQALAPVNTWTQRAARSWQEWVTVCVFEQLYSCGGVNYGCCPPEIHDGSGNFCRVRWAARMTALRAACAAAGRDFDRLWARMRRRVDRLFASGRADEVFKGKWYGWLLHRDLRASRRHGDLADLQTRIPTHLLATLRFDGAWANSLHARCSALIDAHLP